MRFAKLALVFAAAAPLSQAAPIITLPPRAAVRLILNVPEGSWVGFGLPGPQFNTEILTVSPGIPRRGDYGGIRISCAACRPFYLLPPDEFEAFYWDAGQMVFWANLPSKAGRYELNVKNYSLMTDEIGPIGGLTQNPEPSTLLLIGGGLAGIGLWWRRTNAKNPSSQI